MTHVECVVRSSDLLGESPVWCTRRKTLYWIDMYKGLIHRYHPATAEKSAIAVRQFISSIGLQKEDQLIVTLHDQIALLDLNTHNLQVIYTLDPSLAGHRFNDGKCDRQGRFWCTTKNHVQPNQNTAQLYRVDIDRTVHCVDLDVVTGNGLGWDPNNRLMYFVQTLQHTVFVYQFHAEEGTISHKQRFIRTDAQSDGLPDGLTVDAEGGIWVAFYGSRKVIRYTPQGQMDRAIELPVPLVTNCVFGGDQLDTLYITTGQEWMSDEEVQQSPLSGSVFSVRPGVQGIPEPYYQG